MNGKLTFYYFGYIRESGHSLWSNPHNRGLDFDAIPWGTSIDGNLCPPGDPWTNGAQVQGLAALHHKDGWTALAFWDRSVDQRPGSNSAFIAHATLDFDGMMTLARENFPAVIARQPVLITALGRAALKQGEPM